MDFEQALSTILSRFGEAILCDDKKFMAVLFDLALILSILLYTFFSRMFDLCCLLQ